MPLGQFYGLVDFYEFFFKALPFALGLAWLWWVFGNLKKDVSELRETYDGVRKGILVSVWALTPPIVLLLAWWASVLMRNPRIGFE